MGGNQSVLVTGYHPDVTSLCLLQCPHALEVLAVGYSKISYVAEFANRRRQYTEVSEMDAAWHRHHPWSLNCLD